MNSLTLFLRQHRFALADTWQRLRRQPGAFLLNVLVLASAFALPLAGYTMVENLRPLTHKLAADPEISVFMSTQATRADSAVVERQLKNTAGVNRVSFVPREQALTQLKNQTGMADVLTALPNNPLPDAFIVQPQRLEDKNGDLLENLAAEFRQLPQVEHVQVDSAWVRRMDALLRLARLALLVLASALGAAAVAVVFNTIRLQVLLAREEIEVTRLIGATDAFIRRPFFYLGAAQGLLAGAVAWGLTWLMLNPLNQSLGDFARLYAAEFQFSPLPLLHSLAVLTGCAFLGLLGAWLSVSKHLREIV